MNKYEKPQTPISLTSRLIVVLLVYAFDKTWRQKQTLFAQQTIAIGRMFLLRIGMEERVVVGSTCCICVCVCSGGIRGGSCRCRLGGCFGGSLLGPWLGGWLVTAMTHLASHGMLLSAILLFLVVVCGGPFVGFLTLTLLFYLDMCFRLSLFPPPM
jgi:hypothetical protein